MNRLKVAIASLFLSAVSFPAMSQTFSGDCTDTFLRRGFSTNDQGVIAYDKSSLKVFAVDEDAPIYSAATGQQTHAKLRFGQTLWILDPNGEKGRVQVAEFGDDIALGWVDRHTVMCRQEPLRDPETGLWRRIYIQTATRSRGGFVGENQNEETQIEPKQLFRGPYQDCDDSCSTVGRFEWFYVYGDHNDRVLISKSVSLRPSASEGVRGWLPKDDGIPWNSASALRPSIELDTSDPDHLCAYQSLEDLRAKKDCREFLGGYRWFEIDDRLPVIEETQEAWEVIFKGGGNNLGREELMDALNNEKAITTQAEGLSNLDVLFLIDGTNSIKPAIDAIKGTNGRAGLVDQLNKKLRGKLATGGRYRVGFRMFRDSVKGQSDGVRGSEHLAMAQQQCVTDSTLFSDQFRSVQVRDNGSDNDFEENLMGGLRQAIRDIGGCRTHTKIIIVIGDHGYSETQQKSRGHRAYKRDKIMQELQDSGRFDDPPLLFFLQLPEADLSKIKNKEGYERAYGGFKTLALNFIRDQAQFNGKDLDTQTQFQMFNEMQNDMFVRLPSGRVTDTVVSEIVDKIDRYLQPTISTRIGDGGQSVKESIERLQKRTDGVPILWWKMAERRFCDAVPNQCKENVLEKVDTLFIDKADRALLEPELLLTQEQLNQWIDVLGIFKDAYGEDDLVESLQMTLESRIESALSVQVGQPVDENGEEMSLGKILQLGAGLPSGFGSALLSYRPREFGDDNFQYCEVTVLADKATQFFNLLKRMLDGDILPHFDTVPPDTIACPYISDRGKSLQMIHPPSLRFENLNRIDTDVPRNYVFSDETAMFYWIGVEYLP